MVANAVLLLLCSAATQVEVGRIDENDIHAPTSQSSPPWSRQARMSSLGLAKCRKRRLPNVLVFLALCRGSNILQ